MTIGFYETPIWGKKGWLAEVKTSPKYDVDDLLPSMRNGLTVDGKLYAVPFYGESSMLMYRKRPGQQGRGYGQRTPDLARNQGTCRQDA